MTDDACGFDLYHGTSSLFLEGILKDGLGGANPISEWNVLALAREIYPLIQVHLQGVADVREDKIASFGRMCGQASEGWNFQHGDTYVSASRDTAACYAIRTKYGSELVTYTLYFLEMLLKYEVAGIADVLYRRYPHLFSMLDLSPATLLIEARGVRTSDLMSEHGGDPTEIIDSVRAFAQHKHRDLLVQQHNFRLLRPVPASQLRVFFVSVTDRNMFSPKYRLYELNARGASDVFPLG